VAFDHVRFENSLKLIAGLVLCFGVASGTYGQTASPPVSFHHEVMAVLSKAGCNAGACHGNRNGKGGFKLSLRGQDPDADFISLTRDLYGRRSNPIEPDKSLILLKPTAQISHQGGQRFRPGSLEYRILHDWIAAGMPRDDAKAPMLVRVEVSPSRLVLIDPQDHLQVKAVAVFSDGSRRDVSDLAVYEQSAQLAKISPDGLVQRQIMGETAVVVRYLQCQQVVRLAFVPSRPNFLWNPVPVRNYIDEQVLAKLKELRINPSQPCTDTVFLRRAYLDLLGILPTSQEAQEFAEDQNSDKRSQLIDRLLARPEYADFWALKWSDLLRNEERALDRKGVQAYSHWIRQSVATNKPLDEFARELVSARGSTYLNPPTNYYRAERDATSRGEDTAELFLGVRLKCARCHNHPFDRWSQSDYYNWADVFARLNYKVLENRRQDPNDSHEFVGEQIVYETPTGDVDDPRPGHHSQPVLLGCDGAIPADDDRLDAFANWLTSPQNPYFARAQVNRIWYHLMGRGLVDPVDDFRATNPASHPELLDALAADFVAHHYDVQYMIRLIMNSQTYALFCDPNDTNADDEINYSHNIPRRLTAEQLLDAEHEVTDTTTSFNGYPKGMRAAQIPGARPARKPSAAEQFLMTFGKPPRELACECERSSDTTLGQTFQLISGREIAKMISDPDNRIAKLMRDGKSDERVIEQLYWSALTRAPTHSELDAMTHHVASAKDKRQGFEDVLWALLNAKEFVLRT
jgi:hypothetical protein